jgi:hypothetical protein
MTSGPMPMELEGLLTARSHALTPTALRAVDPLPGTEEGK